MNKQAMPLSAERGKQLDGAIQRLDKILYDFDNLSIDDLLYIVYRIKSINQKYLDGNPTYSKSIEDYKNEMVSHLLQKVKSFGNWVVVESAVTGTPFVYDGDVYLFTSMEQGAEFIKEKMDGLGVRVTQYVQHNEFAVDRCLRYNAQTIYINYGPLGLPLSARSLKDEQFYKDLESDKERLSPAKLNPAFTQAVADYTHRITIDEGSEETRKAADVLKQMLINNTFFLSIDPYVQTILPLPVEVELNGEMVYTYTAFTDLQEFIEYNAADETKMAEMDIETLERMLPGANVTINPNTAMLFIGDDVKEYCLSYLVAKNKAYLDAAAVFANPDKAKEVAESILEYDDIRKEFAEGVSGTKVTVGDYSAAFLTKTIVETKLEAYAFLAKARREPEFLKRFKETGKYTL